MSKIYVVRCEHRNVETFTIRANSPEEAKDEADNLVEGRNLIPYDATILAEHDDEGQEADNA